MWLALLLPLGLAACIGGTAGGSNGAVASASPSAVPTESLPADVLKLGEVVPARPGDSAAVIVDEARARQAARDAGASWAGGTAWLVRLTGFGVVDRLVWLIRFTGLSVSGPVPYTSPQITSVPYTTAYYFIDASTGEYLGDTLAGAP